MMLYLFASKHPDQSLQGQTENRAIDTPGTRHHCPSDTGNRGCAPIMVTPKKGSDKIRMCIDLSCLNRYVWRERYQSPTPAEAIADITADDAKYFTIIDAAKGYHQCSLDEESQLYTTFIALFGRFKYLQFVIHSGTLQ